VNQTQKRKDQTYPSTRIFFLILIGIFVFNLLIRVFRIEQTPFSLTWDEVHYITEAKSLTVWGADLTGTWKPTQLRPSNPTYDELTSLAIAPGFLLFPIQPLLAGKFMSILMGSLLPLVLALLVLRLTHSSAAAIGTACIASVNPWLFQLSRSGFDVLFSMFFLLTGFYFMLQFKGWKSLVSLPFFFFGFFQYQGHKPFLPILTGIAALYLFAEQWLHRSELTKKRIVRNLLPAFCIVALSLLLFGWYTLRLGSSNASQRQQEILFFNTAWQTETVEKMRSDAFPSVMTRVIINKYTVSLWTFARQYVEFFNIQQFFLQPDGVINTFMADTFGYFYVLDAVLFIIGMRVLFSRKISKSTVLVFVLLFLSGPLPSAIKTPGSHPWFTFRGGFFFLTCLMLAGIGLAHLYKHWKKSIVLVFLALYTAHVLLFGYEYFARFSLYGTEEKMFAGRVFANYILRLERTHASQRVLYLTDLHTYFFDGLLLYNRWITPKEKENIALAYSGMPATYRAVTMQKGCVDQSLLTENTTIIGDDLASCNGQKLSDVLTGRNTSYISSFSNSGLQFPIINDVLCAPYELGQNVRIFSPSRLEIEKLDDKTFCESLIIKKEMLLSQ
jgi:hypothetical protein